ncbi:hypothetical protein H7X68_03965 [Candidatus Saccharibacteria bacterium]|nr:hypothetical protein [Candidatus Saccharibacteria bacterium]
MRKILIAAATVVVAGLGLVCFVFLKPALTGIPTVNSEKEFNTKSRELVLSSGWNKNATSLYSGCYKGIHEGKYNENYNSRCSRVAANIMSFNGDFKSELLKFENSLTDNNWQLGSSTPSNEVRSISEFISNEFNADEPISNIPPMRLMYSLDGISLSMHFYQKGDTHIDNLTSRLNRTDNPGSTGVALSPITTFDATEVIDRIYKTDRYIVMLKFQQHYDQK